MGRRGTSPCSCRSGCLPNGISMNLDPFIDVKCTTHSCIAMCAGWRSMPGLQRGHMRKASLALGLVFTGFVIDARAATSDPRSAGWTLPGCQTYLQGGPLDFKAGVCVGRIDAISIATSLAGTLCMPDTVMTEQAVRVVAQYIEQRPQRVHELFFLLAAEALTGAWPCN